jgi:phage tail sheath protein FI
LAYNPAGEGKDNNAVFSYVTAARILTDPLTLSSNGSNISSINILAIPGIRDSFVTDQVSAFIRDYALAIYLMDIPSYSDSNVRLFDEDFSTTRPDVRRSSEQFDSRAIDNNFVATYFPDVVMVDNVNNRRVRAPASVAALAAIGFNDRVGFPWFAPAGFNRGALDFVTNLAVRLTVPDRDTLYDARINPIANFPNEGFVIFGQKTLQQAQSALDRVNVRRLLLEVKRIVSQIARNLVFEQNNDVTRGRFVSQVTPQLALIQSQSGIETFRVIMDDTNNSQDDIEQNRLNGRIVIVPTRAIEFIAVDFIVTNAGVSFDI